MGLLHDIGKAIDHEVEGPHAIIGSKLAKKYAEPQGGARTASHHEDVPPIMLFWCRLSGARPGARKEMLKNYISGFTWKTLPTNSRG